MTLEEKIRNKIRLFIPRDVVALALGADEIADKIEQVADKNQIALEQFPKSVTRFSDKNCGKNKELEQFVEPSETKTALELVRTGSRGLFFLEPMIEVEREGGRYAFGPIMLEDVEGLFAADFLANDNHAKALGRTEEIPWLKGQTRLTFARCGIVDPLSLEDYRNHDGLRGLNKALAMTREEIVKCVTESGLRGRGGAGFPTGIKWDTVRAAKATQKYIVCNADEGDSGSFADRMLMEGDPFVLIEGMVIAAIAVGASQGFVYIRSEYPHAIDTMRRAIDIARMRGLLGVSIMGSAHQFDMEVYVGAGAYVCGEETSLLESLEGKRGLVRAKPPLPAHHGLFGQPTVINNVLSLCSVPIILDRGAEFYRDFGMGRSRGTIPIQLAGNVRYGGLYESAFGLTLGEIVEHIGGGTKSGKAIKAVQVGGPLGAYIPPSLFDTPFDYEAFAAIDALVGHAGLVVFDEDADMMAQARFAFEFCAAESCGKCTPCRIGSVRGMEVIDRMSEGRDVELQHQILQDLGETMKLGSLCALGGFTPYPVLSALKYFRQDFTPPVPPPTHASNYKFEQASF